MIIVGLSGMDCTVATVERGIRDWFKYRTVAKGIFKLLNLKPRYCLYSVNTPTVRVVVVLKCGFFLIEMFE